MDFETLDVLYRSRITLLKILKARGYDTTPYERFGPVEIKAMAAGAASASGVSFRMNLERPAEAAVAGITRCRVEYTLNRVKNRLASYVAELTDEMDGTNRSIDFKVSELIVVTIEPVVEAFHAISLNYLTIAEDKCRISFFQAHTIVNNPTEHILVPKHEYVPVDQHAELLKELRVNSKSQLPIIRYHEDMQARVMALIPGDIVKITRPSPSSGVYTVYRVCLPP